MVGTGSGWVHPVHQMLQALFVFTREVPAGRGIDVVEAFACMEELPEKSILVTDDIPVALVVGLSVNFVFTPGVIDWILPMPLAFMDRAAKGVEFVHVKSVFVELAVKFWPV